MTYDEFVLETAMLPATETTYFALGLAGEAGEVADQAKRIIRDDGGELTEDRRHKILLELGDVLWYLTALANHLGISLAEVQRANVEKLTRRYRENKLHGDGDDR